MICTSGRRHKAPQAVLQRFQRCQVVTKRCVRLPMQWHWSIYRAGVVSTRGQSPPACFLNPTICAVEVPSEAANSRAPSQSDSALHNSTVAQALRLASTGRSQEARTGVATRPPPLQPPRLHAQSESLSKPFQAFPVQICLNRCRR